MHVRVYVCVYVCAYGACCRNRKRDRPCVIYGGYWGFNTEAAMMSACGMSAAQVKDFEKARSEASKVCVSVYICVWVCVWVCVCMSMYVC